MTVLTRLDDLTNYTNKLDTTVGCQRAPVLASRPWKPLHRLPWWPVRALQCVLTQLWSRTAGQVCIRC